MPTATKTKIERRIFQKTNLRVAAGSGPPRLTGYAVVFGSRSELISGDFYEVIKQGAFTETLRSGQDVIAKLEHENGTSILGRTSTGTLELQEDARGLHVVIFLPDTSVGRDVHALVARGDLQSMSFSFSTPEGGVSWSRDPSGVELRTVTKANLFDVSVVGSPAYTATTVTARDKTKKPPAQGKAESPVSRRGQLEDQKKRIANMKNSQIERRMSDPKLGFKSVAHWAQTLRNVAIASAAVPKDDRAALGVYGSEGFGTDGGHAVPPAFVPEIEVQLVTHGSQFLALCDSIVIKTNNLSASLDRDPPWAAAGATCYWLGEKTAPTQTKPVLEGVDLPLHKLIGVIPVSEELLDDAPGLSAYIARKLGSGGGYLLDRAILAGTGAATPLGILNSPALKSVTKQAGQGADSVTQSNARRMWSSLYGPSKKRAVWVVHPDAEEGLYQDVQGALPAGQSGVLPVSDNGDVWGRPVLVSEACEALGDKGDIYLVDLSEYLLVKRTPKITQSIHMWFDRNAVAFRFVLRVNGQPWWSAPITSRVGSGTRSPFITLDERA